MGLATERSPGHRRLLIMLAALYLAQGLPVGLVFHSLPAMLRELGASLEFVALVPLASLPWVLKILWAPYVENHWWPTIGRRKSWILPAQIVLASTLVAMALVPFSLERADWLLWLVALASLVASTQDIATDGLAAEQLSGEHVKYANTLQVGCFMLGMLIAGPGVMMVVQALGHDVIFMALAVLVLACGWPLWRWREPEPSDVQPRALLRTFFKRENAMVMLLLGMLSTMGGAVVFTLAKLILLDAGWELQRVGLLTGVGSTLMIILGCLLAAVLVRVFQVWSALMIGLLMVGMSGAAWALLSESSAPSVAWVWGATLVGGLGIGITSVASYSLLMYYVQGGVQPATDFSMFQGSQVFGDIVMGSLATGVAASLGYAAGVGISCAVAVLGILSILCLRRAKTNILLASGAG